MTFSVSAEHPLIAAEQKLYLQCHSAACLTFLTEAEHRSVVNEDYLGVCSSQPGLQHYSGQLLMLYPPADVTTSQEKQTQQPSSDNSWGREHGLKTIIWP